MVRNEQWGLSAILKSGIPNQADRMKKLRRKSLNAYLDNLQSMINQIYRDFFDAGEVITSEGIKCRFIGREVRRHTLMEVIRAIRI